MLLQTRIWNVINLHRGFPGGSDGKESICKAGELFDPWVEKIPWWRKWQPTPVSLPGESHRQRSLVVQSLSHVLLFATPWTSACQASLLHEVCSNSCSLSQWCHPIISSSAACFSSYLQSFPASGSFPMSWLFTPGGQSIRTSAPVLPVNIQGWFPLGLTGLISLLSKGQREAWRATVHGITKSQTQLNN